MVRLGLVRLVLVRLSLVRLGHVGQVIKYVSCKKIVYVGSYYKLYNFVVTFFCIPYFLLQFPRKLFFFEFGNLKVTVHKAKGHST